MRFALAALVFAGLSLVACERTDRDRVRPCGTDDEEPNNLPGNAWDLGSFADEPNSSRERTGTIHTASDADWYRATIYRRGLGTEPLLTVVAPADVAIIAYHSCVGGGAPVDCVWGRPITDENGMGCESVDGAESVIRMATHCSGEQSNIVFRVTSKAQSGECRKYDVRLEAE